MFKPTLPSAEDWLRDPVGTWGRLWQAVSYSIDVYNVTKAQIPVLRERIRVFRDQLSRFPNTAARQSIIDELSRHERAVAALEAQQSSMQGQVVETLAKVRDVGKQSGYLKESTGLGAVQMVLVVAVIAGAAVVVSSIFLFAGNYQARKLESESLGQKVLQFATLHNLTPDEIKTVSEAVTKLPRPKAPGGLFDDLGQLVPIAIGVVAALVLGPPLLRQLSGSMRQRRAA